MADSNAAIECVKSLKKTSCVIVKHANPCGVGSSTNSTDAYKKALSSDPSSAFGGIIALNSEIDENQYNRVPAQRFELTNSPIHKPNRGYYGWAGGSSVVL